MATSKYATGARIPENGRFNPRNSRVDAVVLHHNAGIDAIGEATNPNREVSANYWVLMNGVAHPQIDESRRAWTSGGPNPAGAALDPRAITFEISNSSVGGDWPISEASFQTVAKIVGDIHHRYGIGPVTRNSVRVHSDVQSTACPGPWMMANLNRLINTAETFRRQITGAPSTSLKPGDWINIDSWWNYRSAADAKALRNPVRVMTPGDYQITKIVNGQPHLVARTGKNSGWVHESVLDGRSALAAAHKTHTVVKGDTLYAIARKYSTTVSKVKDLNGLTSNLINPGQKLRVS